ncbi:hypothetical protein B0H19DRAFT_1156694 [Mycena capillaripes]|nr:hypothetical protein B0H19DRAFT_1156694 [Mycena capillaripes]
MKLSSAFTTLALAVPTKISQPVFYIHPTVQHIVEKKWGEICTPNSEEVQDTRGTEHRSTDNNSTHSSCSRHRVRRGTSAGATSSTSIFPPPVKCEAAPVVVRVVSGPSATQTPSDPLWCMQCQIQDSKSGHRQYTRLKWSGKRSPTQRPTFR